MVKILLTVVVVSLLFLDQAAGGVGHDCWSCEIDDGYDDCGKFSASTDKCSVDEGGFCIKATTKGEGKQYGCDGINFCTENGCKNATIDDEPTEVCCCDGNLCNSGSFETKLTGKQCFDCMKTSEGYDDCGNFDSATPKCNVVNETVACITSIATVNGNTASVHGCDDELFICNINGLNNKCVDHSVQGVTSQICCCDGNLCNTLDVMKTTTQPTTTQPSNSGSFLSSSVLMFLSGLLVQL